MRSVVAIVLGVVALCGCASSTSRSGASARGAVEELSRAMRGGDLRGLYAMLPASARGGERFEDFRARMEAQAPELRAMGEAAAAELRENNGPVVSLRAPGREVPTLEEREGWRLGEAGFGPPVGAALPMRAGARGAVRGLRDALSRRSLGSLMAVLSSRAQGDLEAEIAALLDATADPAALEVLHIPPRMQVRLPDGRVLELVEERGFWRVDGIRNAR